jgi:hypothetical protein
MLPEQVDVVVENATRLSFVGPKVKQEEGRVTILHDQPVLGSQRQKSNTPSSSSASPESIQMSDSVSSSSSQLREQLLSRSSSNQGPAPWLQTGSPESGSSTNLHFSPPPAPISQSPSSTSQQYDPFTGVTSYQPVPPPHPQQTYDMSYQDYSMHPAPTQTQPLQHSLQTTEAYYSSGPEQMFSSFDPAATAVGPLTHPEPYSHYSHSPFQSQPQPTQYNQQNLSGGGPGVVSGGDFSPQELDRHVDQTWQAFFAQYK